MRITLAVVVGIAALLVPGTAAAAPPANDDFANATVISQGSLPFSESVTIDEATTEASEPGQCYWSNSQTVWYAFTPSATGLYRLTRSSSFYYQFAALWQQNGSTIGDLSSMGCVSWWYGSSTMTFSGQAGTTYYIQAGANFSSPGSSGITLERIAAPSNDDFASAEVVGSLPFSDASDTLGGTTEGGEPIPSCNYTGQQVGSIWYRYTPAADGWVSASTSGSYPTTVFAAYSGNSLGSLTQLACHTQYGRMTFAVQAGQTYTFLVATLFGVKGNVAFQLEVAPDPVANFGQSISDPSLFDTIQFYGGAYDPGEVGISSYAWAFGDGATSTEPSPTHRFAVDGTYKVRLTVRTPDGRSATSEQTVTVKTHDVAIVKVNVPQSAGVNQTKSIVVGLSNKRYGETVRIDLYRSTASGFVQFASSTQSVPVRGGNKTSDFAFNYTFTSDDASLGKVTFKAVATIVNARDALATDNEFISLPTKVK
jgi:PKD repeat protein